MRALPLLLATLPLAALTACGNAGPAAVEGDAGPAGRPSVSASAAPPVLASAPSAPASAPAPSSPTASRTAPTSGRTTAPVSASASATASVKETIRRTDWKNFTLNRFSSEGKMTFRNGAGGNGPDYCTMLPGGAKPFYAEFLAEEPANAPTTEDALVLVECEFDYKYQMLVPVQIAYDRKTRTAIGTIDADPQPRPNDRMTFLSYRVEDGVVKTKVRTADGKIENRRYRSNGGSEWERF